jgi:hypothetical protein
MSFRIPPGRDESVEGQRQEQLDAELASPVLVSRQRSLTERGTRTW